ncbi:MAG: HypC/HybG/HupF family hydrogenase formation chaperone [Phycisphaerae bacterium]|nr:HypC/HybG/HupF family hydrogenase formation chaperone [Phycisphaerae bacterium]
MCLAIPGKIIKINESLNAFDKTAKVDFSGTEKDIGLLMVPEAVVGEYVLVHAGQAIQIIDEKDAKEIWQYLKETSAE